MDIFLLLYVLGLMVLFFLLGAAIGGTARGMKAHFFGLGENEVFCGESQAAKDRDLAEKSAIAAAALGGAAAVNEIPRGDVRITSDGVMVDANSDWEPPQAQPEDVIENDAEIARGAENEGSTEKLETVLPLTDSEMPEGDDFAGAEIFRGVDAPESEDLPLEDQPAEEVAKRLPEGEAHFDLYPDGEVEMASDEADENPIDAESLVESLPEEVTVASDVESSFEAAQHEPLEQEAAPSLDEPPEAEVVEETEEPVRGEETSESAGSIATEMASGLAGAAVVAAASKLVSDDEGRIPRPEEARPVIWGYLNEDNNFNDIEFIADGDDDLKLIEGIDGDMEAALQALGIRQYSQIASLTAREIAFLRTRLGVTSEISQMGWIEQAKILSSGGLTAFAAARMPAAPVAEADEAVEVEAVEEAAVPVEGAIEATDTAIVEAEIAEAEMIIDDADEISENAALAEFSGSQDEAVSESVTEHREEADIALDIEPESDSERETGPEAETETKSGDMTEPEADVMPEVDLEPEQALATANEEVVDPPESIVRGDHDDDEADDGRMVGSRSDDGRLISRERREQREEELRHRYGSERRVVPPVKHNGEHVDEASADVPDSLEQQDENSSEVQEAAVSHIEEMVEVSAQSDDVVSADEAPAIEDGLIEEADLVSIDEGPSFEAGDVVTAGATIAGSLDDVVNDGADETGDIGTPVDSDDLKQIKHISTGLEKKLNLLGVYKLSQIAGWSEADVSEISEQLELKDRIIEEGWITQAAAAMETGEPKSESGGLFGSALVARLAELDQLENLTEHEKTLLSKHGVTSLSQIANWSGADQKWATELLQLKDGTRIQNLVNTAKGLISSGEAAVPGGIAPQAEDDLKRIRGIDEETEAKLKEVGVTSYAQIAAFEQADITRINDVLGVTGRVERQYWVVQAKVLRDGGTTDYSKLYDGAKSQD